jgi:hypothetical protein
MKSGPKLWLCLAVLVASGLPSTAAKAAPWENLLVLRRVEAEPDKPYNLAKENGPWTILASSFSGDHARQEAHALVLELRKRYKLAAYVYEKEFDFGDETYGRGIDEYGQPLRMRYQRGNEATEVAVMVGDYPAVDDPEAQSTLQKLKYLRPECLKLDAGRPTTRSLAGLRLIQQTVLADGNDKKERGPLGHAFVTTNPMLPRDYFAPKGIDKFVVALNENVPNSLLECPGKYTVQVAAFRGKVVMKPSEIEELESGRHMKETLVKAGEMAERLAEGLRMKGYDAYVFHDRTSSIVTVGSFDSVGTPRADGKLEINPEIHQIMKVFGIDQRGTLGNPTAALTPKPFLDIPFDIQPIPVEVPRRSIAADYSRAMAGSWGGQ